MQVLMKWKQQMQFPTNMTVSVTLLGVVGHTHFPYFVECISILLYMSTDYWLIA